jgi:hypothetical protein
LLSNWHRMVQYSWSHHLKQRTCQFVSSNSNGYNLSSTWEWKQFFSSRLRFSLTCTIDFNSSISTLFCKKHLQNTREFIITELWNSSNQVEMPSCCAIRFFLIYLYRKVGLKDRVRPNGQPDYARSIFYRKSSTTFGIFISSNVK